MKYCNICKCNVNTSKTYCPLCNQTLEGEFNEKQDVFPQNVMPIRNFANLPKKLTMYISLSLCIILFLINIVFYDGIIWSLIPIGSVLYCWYIVRAGILSKANSAQKILGLTTLFILLLCLIDGMSTSFNWALEYATPFILSASSIAIGIIILVKRIEWRDYMLYLLSIAIIDFVPFVFYYTKLINVVWPSIISVIVSTLILLGLFFFWSKPLKAEIKKRLHL